MPNIDAVLDSAEPTPALTSSQAGPYEPAAYEPASYDAPVYDAETYDAQTYETEYATDSGGEYDEPVDLAAQGAQAELFTEADIEVTEEASEQETDA